MKERELRRQREIEGRCAAFCVVSSHQSEKQVQESHYEFCGGIGDAKGKGERGKKKKGEWERSAVRGGGKGQIHPR